MTAIPRQASDITVEWLNNVLEQSGHLAGHRVTTVISEDSDVPGQTAEIAKVQVTYDSDGCKLPMNFIAKYTSRNRVVIDAVVNAYQQYWRETSFYRELPDTGIPKPTCYHAEFRAESQEFILLLNDLAPAVSPSWASTSAQVAQAISHLPPMHARFWNSPLLREKQWLVQFDDQDFYNAAAGAAAAAIPKIQSLFGEEAASTMRLLATWQKKIERVTEYVGSRPFTLVHGDYHSKQMFFPSDAGGEFAVIDWQFSFVAQGAWDLARIMLVGQDIDSRRRSEDELITGYLDGLRDGGVEGYTMTELRDDLLVGTAVNQMIMAVAVADTDISLVEKECAAVGVDWRDVVMKRGEAAARDWEVAEFLDDL